MQDRIKNCQIPTELATISSVKKGEGAELYRGDHILGSRLKRAHYYLPLEFLEVLGIDVNK